MSRKNKDFTREVLPDPKYGDTVITKTVNRIMRHGKKGIAEQALYVALDIVKEKSETDPLPVFKKALDNIAPKVEVRSRRVGGATYQVPTDVRQERRQALAIRWLVEYANKRNEKNLSERLANELLEAAQNRGAAVKKREDTHKMADANKAFAHFKW